MVVWAKPDRPPWVDDELFGSLPRRLSVREVGVRVARRGFRTRRLVVATTLADAATYPADALAGLYRMRWQAELDLRSLKVTLGLDVLRCHSPGLVRAEFWMHVLGYNLIRGVMAEAAAGARCAPRELSFAGAVQAVWAFGAWGACARSRTTDARRGLLAMVGCQRVGDRPNRVEPRARKRRPKHGALLTIPRGQARARLRRGLGT